MSLAVLPRMLERDRGVIVNVAQPRPAGVGSPREAAYAASKFALHGWSEVMAVDLWSTGVEVRLIVPGAIATEIWDQPGNDPSPYGGPVRAGRRRSPPPICESLVGDGFERYVPDLKSIAEFKTADIDAFMAGRRRLLRRARSECSVVKALQFLADPEPWPDDAARRRAPAAAQPGVDAHGAGRPARPAAAGRRLAGAAHPGHRHLRVGLQAGPHGLRRRHRQHDDGLHLVPPGAGPRGGRHRGRAGPAVGRRRAGPAGRAVPQPRLPAPAASRPLCPACERGDYSICAQLPRGAGCRSASTPATRSRPPAASPSGCRRTSRWRSRCPTASTTSWPCWPTRGRCRSMRSPATRPALGAGPWCTAPGPWDRPPRRSSASSIRPSRWPPSPAGRARRELARRAGRRGVRARAGRGAGRGAGGLVGGNAAPPVGGPAGRLSRPHRRRVRHRRLPRHHGGGAAGAAGTGHAGAAGRELARAVRVDALVLQGAAPRRLQRLRRRDLRGPAPARVPSTSSTCWPTVASTSSGMLTHRFRLDEWREAFSTLVHQGETGAIKVAFDFR